MNKYGWVKDREDMRDLIHHFTTSSESRLAPVFQSDLSSKMPPVYDQGQLGSCTANAGAALFEYDELLQHNPDEFVPSRLGIYYDARTLDGDPNDDGGSTIRTTLKVLVSGVGDEKIWPYNINNFNVKPPSDYYAFAKQHKGLLYKKVLQSQSQLELALTQYPIGFGISVYSSFEASTDGTIPLPNTRTEQLLGGHAIVLVGYDRLRRLFKFRNSWGSSWGQHGYGTLPYSYVLNPALASDFWILTKVDV